MKNWLLLTVFAISLAPAFAQSFGVPAFYEAMRQDKIDLVEKQLSLVGSAPERQRQAYEGALLMKKAGLSSGAARKLNLFKQGHRKLEAAIKADPKNVEFRFLRVMIQEHAPGILGYKDDLPGDSDIVTKSYSSLPADVKHAVADYSKKSKVLKAPVS